MTNIYQKTLFVSIARGSAARAFLRSSFLADILATGNVRVVILLYVIDNKVLDYFKEEFDHPLVHVEAIPRPRYSRVRKFFARTFNMLIYSKAEYRHLKYGGRLRHKESTITFWFKHVTFMLMDRMHFLRYAARWCEKHVFKDRAYGELFDAYRPDLVFCTTIYGLTDLALIKEAYFRGIPTVSTPKSWDTVSRQFFRFVSDKLIVANEWMKTIIAREQLMDPKDIFVAGLIQFDVYGKKKEYLSREAFCERTNLDPKKPIILFAPEGLLTGDAERYVREMIADPGFLERYNLIIRPHFSDIMQHRYDEFMDVKGIYLDHDHLRVTNMFYDLWDPTYEDAEWQAEVVKVSDVVVCFMSTMVLDAHILDRPTIVIKYDPVGTTRSVPIDLLYTFPHIEAILALNSVAIAENHSDMLADIDRYLAEPALQRRERADAVAKFAGVIDGNAGARTAKFTLEQLTL